MDGERAKQAIRVAVRKRWRSPLFRWPAYAARRYLEIYRNNEHDMACNGEAEIVRRLAGTGLATAVDVGMHLGLWTDLVLQHHPGARVLGFEAMPDRVDALVRKYADVPTVTVVPVALGASPGTATLHVDSVDPSTTSLLELPGSTTTSIEVEVARGDDHLAAAGIDHVDYLKIDVEGFDFAVLEGFRGALEGGAIDALQFEYNLFNITARHLLADFYDLLDPLGYELGKVHPDGVAFGPYDTREENWVGPSVVAVRRSRPDVVAALRLR